MLGRCLCEAVRYEVTAEPIMLYACHCSDCQTSTGSAFVLAMRLPAGSAAITRGPAKSFVRPRADGRKKNIVRCTECLTALWSESLPAADYMTVYAGTLDDSPKLIPDGHIWTQDAQPWIVLPEGVPSFEQGPPDMELLAQARRARQAG
jgi:hypothetical protein